MVKFSRWISAYLPLRRGKRLDAGRIKALIHKRQNNQNRHLEKGKHFAVIVNQLSFMKALKVLALSATIPWAGFKKVHPSDSKRIICVI
jgi:hypothetical protein